MYTQKKHRVHYDPPFQASRGFWNLSPLNKGDTIHGREYTYTCLLKVLGLQALGDSSSMFLALYSCLTLSKGSIHSYQWGN